MNWCITVLFCLVYIVTKLMALTPSERKEFLDIHNYLRRAVVPPAADMQELVYDEELEMHVNQYLQQCKFEHRGLNNYGENGRLDTDKNITNSVMSWFQERVYFNISSNDKRCSQYYSKYDFMNGVQCRHYQMMVKSTLKSLGCGYKFCETAIGNNIAFKNSYITICFYDSWERDQPYKIGQACTACEADYKFCHNEMCVPKEKYNKHSRTCKLKCENCGTYFDSEELCICKCPDGTKGNNCRGVPINPVDTCTPCRAKGLSCNGGIEIHGEKCLCKCDDQYQGEYCEVRKAQFEASYFHRIDGLSWRYNTNIPVNVAEFKNSFGKIQNIIARDVIDLCTKEIEVQFNCSDRIYSRNVLLVPGSLSMLQNGSLIFRMSLNYTEVINGSDHEQFVSSSILSRIWNNKSSELQDLIDNVKRINPIAEVANINNEIDKSNSKNKPILNNMKLNVLTGKYTTSSFLSQEDTTEGNSRHSTIADKISEYATEKMPDYDYTDEQSLTTSTLQLTTTKKEANLKANLEKGIVFFIIFSIAFLVLI